MKEELYIDDQIVDLYPDKPITLNFKSNILHDISKITASNSYTIQLPKTTHNRCVLDNPTAPAYDSRFRYRTHAARYLRNGMTVIDSATAIVMESSESYEIALTWGVLQALKTWVSDAPKLSDLPDDGTTLAWDENTVPDSYPPSAGAFFADYNTGVPMFSEAKKFGNIHPSVRVGWILEQIEQANGFTLDIPSPQKEAIEKLAIPLFETNGNVTSWNAQGYKSSDSYSGRATGVSRDTWYAILPTTYTQGSQIWTDPYFDTGGSSRVRIYVSGQMLKKSAIDTHWDNPSVRLYEGSTWDEVVGAAVPDYKWDAEPIPGHPDQGYTMLFDQVVTLNKGTSFWLISTSDWRLTDATVYVSPYDVDLHYPAAYPIVPNLPNIKQIDFIKALCAMFGLFAMPSGTPNTIRLVSLDVLLSNIGSAIDWSNKLIDAGDHEPKSTAFTFGDFAQRNNLKYKEDDTVKIDADGVLAVDDESLDPEEDLITLPFAASSGNIIAHYKWKDSTSGEGRELEEVKVEPRIMNLTNVSGKCALSFDGLKFSELIADYYVNYQALINQPVVIKERFTLTEYDLQTLDYTVPVYLRQYGRYYGIVTIQTSSAHICEVQLLQLSESANQ